MAAPKAINKTKVQLDNNTIDVQLKLIRAENSYNYIKDYDWTGVGSAPMPDFEWAVPTTGKVMRYRNGIGQLEYDYIPYPSLGFEERVIFWQWLDKFVHQAILNYNKNYGL